MRLVRNYSKQRFIPTTGKYPLGFNVGSVATKVKKSGDLDLSLITSSKPCEAVGIFTKNKFCAAPVTVSRNLLNEHGKVHSLLVNSGCANACTGDQGLKDAKKVQEIVQDIIKKPGVLVMSTGVIGQHLQMDKISNGVSNVSKSLGQTHEHWMNVAKGVMTTDTFPKLKSAEYTARGGKYRIAGWAKGAGMIHPNMATMLAGIFTDAKVSKECLKVAITEVAEMSFNVISVDGDTSTNDTFVVMANGASNVEISDVDSPEFKEFVKTLGTFAKELAQLIVRDGEGATKFIEVRVKGANTIEQAKLVCNSIAKSPLVKTAIYGKDANWGRIICAVGYSGADFDPNLVSLDFGSKTKSLNLFKNGMPFEINEEIALSILENEDIFITVDLGLGSFEHAVYTCDFSHEYVSINADYRS